MLLVLLQYDKFNDVDFGRCSRVYCEGQALLPVGQSDIPRKFTVTLYCPRCNDIYYPKSSRHASECPWPWPRPVMIMMMRAAAPVCAAGVFTPGQGATIHRGPAPPPASATAAHTPPDTHLRA